MADLPEADAVLNQAARHQKLLSELVSRFGADAIQVLHVLRFLGQIHDTGRAELHACRELIGVDAGGDIGVELVPLAEFAVQARESCHLLITLCGNAAGRWLQIRNRHGAGLEGRGCESSAEVTARQLHRRRGAAYVDISR